MNSVPVGAAANGQSSPAMDRFVGALLGGTVGDALGFPVESMPPAAIKASYGAISDLMP